MKIYRLFFVLLLCAFGACTHSPSLPQKPIVLVSLPPYMGLVESIAQDKVDVVSLTPEKANPHLYEPSPKQLQQALTAKLWIRINEPFERKLLTLFKEKTANMHIVNLSDKMELLSPCCEHDHHHHSEEEKDFHIWLSPRLLQSQIQEICEALSEVAPEHKDLFTKNTQILLGEVRDLDSSISGLLSPLSNKSILVSHPAFSYFCKDYGLTQYSTEIEGKDPLPRDITHLLEKTKRSPPRIALLQTQYNNKGTEIIARDLQIPTFTIDPYQKDVLQTLRQITYFLAEADDS